MKKLIGVILMMSAATAFAVAEEQGHLNVTTVVQKEEVTVNEAGEADTRLVAAETVIPGDRVVYTITFQNISEPDGSPPAAARSPARTSARRAPPRAHSPERGAAGRDSTGAVGI